MPLTDTQLRLLSAASQRADTLLVPLDHLTGGARVRVAATLLRRGLVAEVAVGRDDPVWREDEADGHLGLRITAEGLGALGLEPEAADGGEASAAADAPPARATLPASGPRSGSKAAAVLALLARPEGAVLADLTATTGWLPHTVRAALSGLRRRGYAVSRERDADGRLPYRLTQAEG